MNKVDIKNNFEFFLFLGLSKWLRSQPIERALSFHTKLAKLWFDILRIRRDETIKNLGMAFPEKNQQQLELLAQKIFLHFSRFSVEHILMPKFYQKGFNGILGSANWEVLEKIFDRGKGVMVLTGHFGNWELLGTMIQYKGFPTWAIAAEMRNFKVDRLIQEHRLVTGGDIIFKDNAKIEIPKVLKNGEIVYLLSDQDAGDTGVFVPFLGRPAATAIGPALFVLRNQSPLVYATALFKDGKYNLYFEEIPIPKVNKNLRQAIQKVTELHVNRLEKDIRRYPEQWFWLHRRWKTVPKGPR